MGTTFIFVMSKPRDPGVMVSVAFYSYDLSKAGSGYALQSLLCDFASIISVDVIDCRYGTVIELLMTVLISDSIESRELYR